jgi:hypothetical protein
MSGIALDCRKYAKRALASQDCSIRENIFYINELICYFLYNILVATRRCALPAHQRGIYPLRADCDFEGGPIFFLPLGV